jgi:peptidoglycan/xylan/chitin deacetylase (PgdA/CDA1 family)
MSDVLTLCYHAVADRWTAPLSVTPEALESQLRLLVERGYRGSTFADAVSEAPAPKTLVVTFDDAYRSVIDRALPILSKFGLPATVFTVTSFAGSEEPMTWPGIDGWIGGPYEPELAPMSWDELSELAAAGWEIGSHTVTHPRLTSIDDAELAEELTRSRDVCSERIGTECRSLAFPYGDYDDRVVAATQEAGYSTAATLTARLQRPEPLRWPRVGVYHADDMHRFRAKVSPSVRRLRATRAWALVEPERS